MHRADALRKASGSVMRPGARRVALPHQMRAPVERHGYCPARDLYRDATAAVKLELTRFRGHPVSFVSRRFHPSISRTAFAALCGERGARSPVLVAGLRVFRDLGDILVTNAGPRGTTGTAMDGQDGAKFPEGPALTRRGGRTRSHGPPRDREPLLVCPAIVSDPPRGVTPRRVVMCPV
jgi:hypothetical protein